MIFCYIKVCTYFHSIACKLNILDHLNLERQGFQRIIYYGADVEKKGVNF